MVKKHKDTLRRHLAVCIIAIALVLASAWVPPLEITSKLGQSSGYVKDRGVPSAVFMSISKIGYEKLGYFGSAQTYDIPNRMLIHDELPGWSVWKGLDVSSDVCTELATGFPFRCMHCYWTLPAGANAYVIHHGVDFNSGARTFAWGAWSAVPLKPLWVGFVGNTLVYAACLHAMWSMVNAVRRWKSRRGARRPCIACGYELAGMEASVCPECGEPFPKAS